MKKLVKALGGTLGYLCLIAIVLFFGFYMVIGSFGLLIPVLIVALIAVPFVVIARSIIVKGSHPGEKH
jgi:hypothetical protein